MQSKAGKQLDEGRELVISFVQFTSKVLQNEMSDFFADNAHLFDQEAEDIALHGETLEQYDIFKKYEQILEGKIEGFCNLKGFSSSRDCFNAIEDAIGLDKDKQKSLLADLQAKFAQMRASMNIGLDSDAEGSAGAKGGGDDQNDAKADAKENASDSKSSGDAKGGDAKGGSSKESQADDKRGSGGSGGDSAVSHMPTMNMLFPPMPLDRMLDNIMRLTEYTTFSGIMRNKVKQIKFMKELEERVRWQEEDAPRRAELNKKGGRYHLSGELMGDLYKRLSTVVPVAAFAEDIKRCIDLDVWDTLLGQRNLYKEEEKLQMKKIISFTFSHIQRLGLIEDFQALRATCIDLMKLVDDPDCETDEVAYKFLHKAHATIDQAESNLLKAYKSNQLM